MSDTVTVRIDYKIIASYSSLLSGTPHPPPAEVLICMISPGSRTTTAFPRRLTLTSRMRFVPLRNNVLPWSSVPTTLQTPMSKDPAITEDQSHKSFNLSHYPITSVEVSTTSSTIIDTRFAHKHRRTCFDHLRIRKSCVGGMLLYSMLAMPAWSRSCASSDGSSIIPTQF